MRIVVGLYSLSCEISRVCFVEMTGRGVERSCAADILIRRCIRRIHLCRFSQEEGMALTTTGCHDTSLRLHNLQQNAKKKKKSF